MHASQLYTLYSDLYSLQFYNSDMLYEAQAKLFLYIRFVAKIITNLVKAADSWQYIEVCENFKSFKHNDTKELIIFVAIYVNIAARFNDFELQKY